MNLENFVDITPKSGHRSHKANKIFMTVKDESVSFSKNAVLAMTDVAYVRIMTNKEEGKILIVENGNGIGFMKPNRKGSFISWHRSDVLDTIKAMLPDDVNHTRIMGEAVDVMGKKGLVFYCDNLEPVRAM